MTKPTEIFFNSRVVLADRIIENGYVAISDGLIVEIGEGEPPEKGIDCAGDLLMPGLVELHTDHVEAHLTPRPKVNWDPIASVISYDAQIATSGITTVLDSLRVLCEEKPDDHHGQASILAVAIDDAKARQLLRVNHYLHLRCEVPMPHIVAKTTELVSRSDVKLLSLMNHTPGQRQFRDMDKLRDYYRGKSGGMSEAELDDLFARRLDNHANHAEGNYADLITLAREYGTPLASHDDTTLEHVDQAINDKVALAEFPTTMEAAHKLHQAGIRVMMGAPNLVRGGSHSGNIATRDLAREGLLDIMSSDYVPSSLLAAAIRLPDLSSNYDLPSAIATVTKTPAETVGFHDRGEIALGKRADLIRVHVNEGAIAVRGVWNMARRVA